MTDSLDRVVASTQEQATVCPYLTALHDSSTFHAYPSQSNGCGRVDQPARLPGSYQVRVCLSSRHTDCPVAAPSWSGPFPADLRAGAEREWGIRPAPTRRRRAALAGLGLIALVATAAAVWLRSGRIPPLAPAAPTEGFPAAAFVPPATDVGSPTPWGPATAAPSLTPTQAPTALPTALSEPTVGPGLETPVGTGPAFLIHVVRDGDSLNLLARNHGTTEAAIQAVNGLGQLPLWVGQMLVIPVGVSDAAGLPRLSAAQVAETGETLAALAARYGADPAAIRTYNLLGEGPWLPAGRWLIIPMP